MDFVPDITNFLGGESQGNKSSLGQLSYKLTPLFCALFLCLFLESGSLDIYSPSVTRNSLVWANTQKSQFFQVNIQTMCSSIGNSSMWVCRKSAQFCSHFLRCTFLPPPSLKTWWHHTKKGAKKFQLLVLLPVWLVETVVATVDDDKDDEVAVLQSVQGEPSFSSLRVSHLQVNRSLQ